MTKRILNVVTNVSHYDDPSHPTGLWLSELTHAWHVFEEAGFEQTLVSPAGGGGCRWSPAPEVPELRQDSQAWRADPERMALLKTTLAPEEVDSSEYDAIYFTGGHAVMYDFPRQRGPAADHSRDLGARGGHRLVRLPRLLRPARNEALRRLLPDRGQADDRLRLDRGGPRARRQARALQRRGAGEGARCPLREGEAAVRLVRRRRRQPGHRQNPGSAKETATKVAALLTA